eukprot:Selendium_serpulae@DN6348_c0_g2_i1.p1
MASAAWCRRGARALMATTAATATIFNTGPPPAAERPVAGSWNGAGPRDQESVVCCRMTESTGNWRPQKMLLPTLRQPVRHPRLNHGSGPHRGGSSARDSGRRRRRDYRTAIGGSGVLAGPRGCVGASEGR